MHFSHLWRWGQMLVNLLKSFFQYQIKALSVSIHMYCGFSGKLLVTCKCKKSLAIVFWWKAAWGDGFLRERSRGRPMILAFQFTSPVSQVAPPFENPDGNLLLKKRQNSEINRNWKSASGERLKLLVFRLMVHSELTDIIGAPWRGIFRGAYWGAMRNCGKRINAGLPDPSD